MPSSKVNNYWKQFWPGLETILTSFVIPLLNSALFASNDNTEQHRAKDKNLLERHEAEAIFFKVCSEGSNLQPHGCDERANVPSGLQVRLTRRFGFSDILVFSGCRGNLSSGQYQTLRTRMTSKK